MSDVAVTPTTIIHGGASLLGALVVYFGPQLGPWIAVLIASTVGSLWTVGAIVTITRTVAALLWLRTVLTACVLTGGLAVVLDEYISTSLDYTLPLIAFTLGALGDKFETIRIAVVKRVQSWLGGKEE